MKKILLACRCFEAVEKAWERLGYSVYKENVHVDDMSICALTIGKCVKDLGIDMVFTFSFSPNLSKVCSELNIVYISWIWDCPHAMLWAKEARNNTNRIFIFDYSLYEKLLRRGLNNVFYLPLASDYEWFDRTIEDDDNNSFEKFGSDVTFLGNFYNDEKHDLYADINYLPQYVKGYLEGIIACQKSVWGADLLEDGINNQVWNEIKKYIRWDLNDRYEDDYFETIFRNILGQHIAKLERMEMCSRLTELFDFKVYSDCSTAFDKNIVNRGHADYLTEMPLIFRYSKINIHITIRSIPTGVPLRVVDVLASKGFLLTNYQSEIAEYFEDGVDLVIYSDFDDMIEKIEYYLENEEERIQIACNGYNKVKQLFSYDTQIEKIDKLINQ